MKYVLGVDIGTGSSKAVAVDFNGKPVGVSQSHYPTFSPALGYSEQNPELIWDAFKNCILEIAGKMPHKPASICLSSAMHSLIPVDKNGNRLSEMITWADCRSDKIATRLKESSMGMRIYELSGMPLHAMSPLCKIIWFRENLPDVFNRTYKFISIKEYIWFKLFGEYVIDHSIASATGMLDIASRTWNAELLALAGIRENQLSKLVSTNYQASDAGSFADTLTSETTFVVGASDGCLANLGSFANREGCAALTIGTSGAVRIASDKPILNPAAMTFSYCLDEETFICGGPVNNGGNVLQWLITSFLGKTADQKSYDEVFSMVDQVAPGSDGLVFLPYLHGERAPIWDAKSSGSFVGIRSLHTQAHFCRAVLEGICFALYEVLLAVEQESVHINQVNVSGGFVNSQIWMQLLADITGRRLVLIQTEDASAIGAAYMAMKVLGVNGEQYPSVSNDVDQHIIEPDLNKHELLELNFQIFKDLYSILKTSMHQLNRINS